VKLHNNKHNKKQKKGDLLSAQDVCTGGGVKGAVIDPFAETLYIPVSAADALKYTAATGSDKLFSVAHLSRLKCRRVMTSSVGVCTAGSNLGLKSAGTLYTAKV